MFGESHTVGWGYELCHSMVWVLPTGCSFHKPVVPETGAPAYSNDHWRLRLTSTRVSSKPSRRRCNRSPARTGGPNHKVTAVMKALASIYPYWPRLGCFFKAALPVHNKADQISLTPLTPFSDQLAFACRS
jgi:hypothetical protein